jgi:hypothetical protein
VTAARAWDAVVRAWDRIPLREPWRVLVPLLAMHWIALIAFISQVRHNSWLFYQGGDQIWYWTTGWALGRGSIVDAFVSQGWSLLLVPFTWIGGPGFLGGLPGPLLLQTIVLAPIALWCVYELGARIGGRAVGYWTALLWTVGPFVVIQLFVHRYHEKYVEQFLPLPLGLTGMADYPSIVCLLVAAVLAVRAMEGRSPRYALLAGLATGFAAVIKPSNLIFVAAPLVLFVASRRWRELAVAALAVVPGLVALALWKYRSLGYVPAFSYGELHTALGPDTVRSSYDKYVKIDWHTLDENLASLREVFWSMRVLQWLPFAGAIAVARRSIPLALFLSAWFWGFFLLKGSTPEASVDSGSFFRLLMPAMPAYVLLAGALPLLVPKLGVDWARRTALPRPQMPGRRALIVALCVFALLPVVGAAAALPLRGGHEVIQHLEIGVPVDGALDLTATVRGGTVALDWKQPRTSGTRVFYKVFRSPASTDYICFARDPGADQCTLVSVENQVVRGTAAVDRPGTGTWTYRVGTGANWVDDPGLGDIFLLSNPVTVTVP